MAQTRRRGGGAPAERGSAGGSTASPGRTGDAAGASDPLAHPLFGEHAATLDRAVALLEEDQALRHDRYDHPDPRRRRLRVACNACETPWCCNQRVDVGLLEALVIYRYALVHAPDRLEAAVARGRRLHAGPPRTDAEHFRRREPCPLLFKDRCVVFPVRPGRCRSHYMAGNPLRCRDELAPRDSYEMNPDPTLVAEIERLAEDLAFFAQVRSVGPTELSELLALVDAVARRDVRWSVPTKLDWPLVE